MTATILNGKQLAETMQQELTAAVAEFVGKHGTRPGLATVRVGEDPASKIYVRNKCKACEQTGIASFPHELPAETPEAQLLNLVEELNRDPRVHGILVQLPLPRHINSDRVLRSVTPLKDVDGFGPENLGLLTVGKPRFVPCTPVGVHRLLVRHGICVKRKHVVIVGRSTIVGKPLALLLLRDADDCNATVTVCGSEKCTDRQVLTALTRQADVIVMAIGQARFLKADMVKPGAVVVDVGINRLPDGKLVGDVDFEPVSQVASAITPVPGGVGPMTITMLLQNTMTAAQLQRE